MSKIGKLGICSACRLEKPVYEHLTQDGKTVALYCQDCFMKRGTYECAVCKIRGARSMYYEHLMSKHKQEDLAKYFVGHN